MKMIVGILAAAAVSVSLGAADPPGFAICFRMLYRDADGNPEQHDAIIDVVLMQSGEGTLQLGGVMAGRRATSAGEWVGTRLDGGDRHPLGPGDIVHIPAGVPHAFLVPQGKHVTYVLLKIPATHQR
jgi:hypothetical protein